MTCLADYSTLSTAELDAELERMFANHHAPRRNYAERMFSTAACSDTGNPLPADTAVRGTYFEEIA